MTKLRLLYPLLFAFALVFFAQSCEDEDPSIENEEEVITSVNLTLFALDAGNEDVVLAFQDADGEGGNDPMMSQTGVLRTNASYRGQLSFGNEDGSIDGEIVEEGLEHQVFYEVGAGLNMSVEYTDSDALGQPIGLNTTFTTGGFGSGNLTVTLRHEPNKAGAQIDNPAAAGGSTDAEVVFTLSVQ